MNESDANQKEFYILNLDLELSKLLPEPQDDSGYNEIYEISNKTTWRANVNELLSNKDKRVETLTCLDNEFQKIGTLYETEKDEDDPINNFALFLTAFKTHDQFERFLGKVGVRQKPNSGTVERILRSKPIKDKDNGSNPDRVLDKCCVYIDGSTKTRSCKKKPFPGTTSCLPPIEEHIDPRIVSTVSTFPNASIDGAIKLVYTKVVDELHKLHKSQSSENTARVIRDDSVKNKITNFEFGSSQLQADHVSAISSYLGKRIIDFDVLCEQRLSALSSKQQHFYEDVVEWKNDLIEQGILYATDYDKNLYDNKKFYDTNNTPTEVDHGAYRELMDVWKEKIDFDEVEFRERFREKYDEIQLISIPVDEQKSNSSSHNNEDEDEDKYSSSPTAQPLEFITFGAGKPEQSITERRKLYDDFMGKKWKLGIKMGNRLVGMNPYNNAFLCHRTNTMRSDANEHNSVLRIGSMLPIRERQLLHLLYQLNISFKIVTLHRNGVTIDLGEPIQPTVLSKNHQETATMIHLIPNRFLSDTALEFIDGSMYDTGKAVHDDILGTLSEVVIPLLGDVRRKFLPLYEYYTIPSRHDSVRYKCYHPKCKYGYSDAEKKRTCKNAGWKDFVEHLNFDLSCDACKLSIDEERKKAKHKKTNCDIRRQRRKKCVDCVVQFPLPKKYEENNANCLIEHGIVYQFLYPLDNCITANKWKGDRKRKEIEPDVGTKGTKKKQKKGERQIVKTSYCENDDVTYRNFYRSVMIKCISQCPMPIQCASVYVLGTEACATYLRSYIDVLIGGVIVGVGDVLATLSQPYRERIKENIMSNLSILREAPLEDMHVGYKEDPETPMGSTTPLVTGDEGEKWQYLFLPKDIEYYKYLHALLLLLEPDGTSQSSFRKLCSFNTKKTETFNVVNDSGNLKLEEVHEAGVDL